jgi:hypothetical protein
MELYANGDLDRESYVKKSTELDGGLKQVGLYKIELSKQIPAIHNEIEVDIAIKQYCETVKLRHENCIDFETSRKFCLDFITEITHFSEGFTLRGKIPVGTTNQSYLEFKVEKKITSKDRGRRRLLWHGY